MKSRGVQPNEVTYTELINICGRSGDVHQALVGQCLLWASHSSLVHQSCGLAIQVL